MESVRSIFGFAVVTLVIFFAPFNASCSIIPKESEEQALQTLRELTKDGALPPENVVAQIESRFSNTQTGALAKLLRARVRLQSGDGRGAAVLLQSSIFRQQTSVTDYALWLRGKSLSQAALHAEAMRVFEDLLREFPSSLRAREAKILWAQSAIASGQTSNVGNFLRELVDAKDVAAIFLVGKSFEQQTNLQEAAKYYRRAYFLGAGSEEAKQAEIFLNANGGVFPQTSDEALLRANKLFENKNYTEASAAYENLVLTFPQAVSSHVNLRRLISFGALRKLPEAQIVFGLISSNADEKPEAYDQLARAYATVRQWEQARKTAEEMRRMFPVHAQTAKTFIALGLSAREQKDKPDENYFLRAAVAGFPNSLDVAQAQFELAWLEHESKIFSKSSQMFIEHLARYADKNTTNRGRAGYWSARDSERAGKFNEACALYNAMLYRYAANWYGYLASQRQTALRNQGKCKTIPAPSSDSMIAKAVANLKTVTIAKENVSQKENERIVRADQLSTIGLFDWGVDELNEAAKTAANSPKVNMALANLHRRRRDPVNALLSLARSYPDYSQMFPEEMSREEWDIFYPLTNFSSIKRWSQIRSLDIYQVAGLIRQESIFDPRAKSSANAYGLMQLLVPTARGVAKKYGSSTTTIFGETLFEPELNIELGTAYLRDLFNKFGKLEYVAIAYNAGPNRVAPWRASLPPEIDEFVEAIPFRETKGYVQGVIRNTAQYRRLYDDSGNFLPNVGTRNLRAQIDAMPAENFLAENKDVKLTSEIDPNN